MRRKALEKLIKKDTNVWLITGVAGFIGSNLLERLLSLDQIVIGVDNFSTGYIENIYEVQNTVSIEQWKRFKLIEDDISDSFSQKDYIKGVDYVLHQAALGSVPRSIEDPINSNQSNVTGFLNIIHASMLEGVKSFTYASSSSVYGDNKKLPKNEEIIGNQLSPYALTKYINEQYSMIYSSTYNFRSIGLRYFNVFGKRQSPKGAYAAVIPKWIESMLRNEQITIYGDGETTRDFCYIENVIQANLLSALHVPKKNQIFNIACGTNTSLNELFLLLKKHLEQDCDFQIKDPQFQGFRKGDVRHSLANIDKAKIELDYLPTHFIEDGIKDSISWYVNHL